MVASARPRAVAAVLIELALAELPPGLNSTIAALAGLMASPTPMPWNTRPAKSQPTSGASAKNRMPIAIAATPASSVARLPT